MYRMLRLSQIVANYPTIATGDSGVSWGALIGIITIIVAGGSASLGFFWRNISVHLSKIESGIEALRKEQSANNEKMDTKVEKVEAVARSARANQRQEHNDLRDRVTKSEAKAEAQAAINLKTLQ